MRKFILIAGFVLASATAQAGERSLSLAGSDVQAAPVQAQAKIADAPKTAQAPQATDAPKAETTKAEAPKAAAPKIEETTTEPAKPVKTAKSEKPRRKQRYWTEGRIIGELHRHGVYW